MARGGGVISVNRRIGVSNKLLIQFDDTFGTLRCAAAFDYSRPLIYGTTDPRIARSAPYC